MNCNCRAELEAKLTERHAQQCPEAKNHQVTLEGYCMGIVGDRMVELGVVPISARAEHLVKKSGEYKAKASKGNMVWSFCPFCGKPVTDLKGGAA